MSELFCNFNSENSREIKLSDFLPCYWSLIISLCLSRCPESLRPETVRPCLLPCKKDCIVTPYSDWTSCPSSCKEGMVCRVRKAVHLENPLGRLLRSSGLTMFVSFAQGCVNLI